MASKIFLRRSVSQLNNFVMMSMMAYFRSRMMAAYSPVRKRAAWSFSRVVGEIMSPRDAGTVVTVLSAPMTSLLSVTWFPFSVWQRRDHG